MIYNKFINCQTLEIFNANLDSGEIIDQHVVFIEDVKQIWTNGTFYGANEFSQEDLTKLTSLADVLVMDGDGTKVLSNNGTYVTMPSFSETESETLLNLARIVVTDGDGTKVLANNGQYVSIPQLSTTDVTSVKNLLSIIKTDGDGTKVLADDGSYVTIGDGSLGTITVGSETKHVYFKDGQAVVSSSTIGSGTKPVYMNGGAITECGSSLAVSITGSSGSCTGNSATATSAGYITRNRGANSVTTLTNLPVDKDTIVATLSAATTISLKSAMNIGESLTIVCKPTASFTQPIPNSGSWKSMDGDSLSITSGKWFEINIYCYGSGTYSVSSKTEK